MTIEQDLDLKCKRCFKVGYFLPEGLCWPCQLALNPETPDRPLPDDCKTLQLDECVTYGSSIWYVAELPRFNRETGRWWIRISGTHSSRRKDGDWVGVSLDKITRNLENELEDKIEQAVKLLRELEEKAKWCCHACNGDGTHYSADEPCLECKGSCLRQISKEEYRAACQKVLAILGADKWP